MTKKEINKTIIKTFIKHVNDQYNVSSDFEDADSGNMDFGIKHNNEDIMFQFHRNSLDVYTWKVKGDKGYQEAFDLECSLQTVLNNISIYINEKYAKQ